MVLLGFGFLNAYKSNLSISCICPTRVYYNQAALLEDSLYLVATLRKLRWKKWLFIIGVYYTRDWFIRRVYTMGAYYRVFTTGVYHTTFFISVYRLVPNP